MVNADDFKDHHASGVCMSCGQCPATRCPKRLRQMDLVDFEIRDGGMVVLRWFNDVPWFSLIVINGITQWDWDGVFYD